MDGERGMAGLVSEALRAHPAVAALTGVRIAADEPVEVTVVLRLDGTLPALIRELRAVVHGVTGDVPVNLTVADVVSRREATR